MEVSLRKDLEPEVKEIVPIYHDVRSICADDETRGEILAKKVRAIFIGAGLATFMTFSAEER